MSEFSGPPGRARRPWRRSRRRVPWLARTLITRRMLSNEQGAVTSLYCATSPLAAGENGLYYDKNAALEPSSAATPELAALLWRRCCGGAARSGPASAERRPRHP